MAGAGSQQQGNAGLIKAERAQSQANSALTASDIPDSSSPAQQTNGAPLLQQHMQQAEVASPSGQHQQQQQDKQSSMHLSEARYELGPELKQVSKVS